MKTHILSGIVAVTLLAAFTGCETGPSIAYDPSLKTASGSNKISVVGISAVPTKPVAHQAWKAVMKVKNLSKETLRNVSYEFVYDGGATKLGSGTIPQIAPGQTVEVVSDPGDKLNSGSYRVEGRVFVEGLEPLYSDRMDNWKNMSINVAQ